MRPFYHFCQVATGEVVPVLLTLLTKQDEDASDEEYNISRAAYQCLQLYAQAVRHLIIQPVLTFVEANLRHDDWHHRDAAVSAFGAIMEGPEESTLEPIVKQALPVVINMMSDKELHVKDSTAYALGRITEFCSEAIDPQIHLPQLIGSLFEGLVSSPKMAGSCCWTLMNLAERFSGDIGCQTNPISPHFHESITRLLQVTERADSDNQLRTAAYEVLNTFVQNAANDSLANVASLSDVIIKRLEGTIPLQQQVVSVEDKITLEEMQTSLCTVLLAIIQRLEKEITPQANHIMTVLLQILNTAGAKSSVPDAVFATVSSLANALEDGFATYMEAFSPFLYNALGNQEEPSLCSMAIGLVSDITRSMGPPCQPYCDTFMNYLLNNLRVCNFRRCIYMPVEAIQLFLVQRPPQVQYSASTICVRCLHDFTLTNVWYIAKNSESFDSFAKYTSVVNLDIMNCANHPDSGFTCGELANGVPPISHRVCGFILRDRSTISLTCNI